MYDDILNLYYNNLICNYSDKYIANYQLAIQLLKKYNTISISQKCCSINLLNDLGIFQYNGIIDKIINTQSIVGKLIFQKKLFYPISNIEFLKIRQKNLQNLLENKHELKLLFSSIHKFGSYEIKFFEFYKKNTKEVKELLNNIYFQNKYLNILNTNSYYQQTLFVYKSFIMPINVTLTPFLTLIIPLAILKFYYKFPISISQYIKILKVLFKSVFCIDNLFAKKNLLNLGGMIISIITYIYSVYQNIIWSLKINRILKILKDKLINLENIVLVYKKCYNIINKLQIVLPNTSLHNEKLDNIISMLNNISNSNSGKILSSYYTINENIDNIIPIYQYIGEVDSLVSDVITIIKYSNKKYNLSFCKFNNTSNINVNIKNFYHLNIPDETIIPNSIKITKNNKTVLITGPNAAGKSTIMKSVMLSIYLSQTLTFAPCSYIEISPFEYIDSFFSVRDLEGEYSMFEAEIKKIKQYINNISGSNKSIIAIDEIFNNTNYKEGIDGANIVINYLHSIKNNISLVSTHYHKLAHMLNSKEGFQNYCVKESKKNPYKLYKGINNKTNALELFRKKFLT